MHSTIKKRICSTSSSLYDACAYNLYIHYLYKHACRKVGDLTGQMGMWKQLLRSSNSCFAADCCHKVRFRSCRTSKMWRVHVVVSMGQAGKQCD